MSNRKRKPTKAPRRQADHSDIAPTPEQMGDGNFVLQDVTERSESGRMISIGKAFRRKPMIDTLHEQGVFSDREHKCLTRYAHFHVIANKSPIRDSLQMERYGSSGNGMTNEQLYAIEVVRDCEAAAGQLRDILKAVVLEDMSLSQWAISQAGGVDDCVMKNGTRVCRIKPRQKALAIAKLEIKMVAARVEAEMSA